MTARFALPAAVLAAATLAPAAAQAPGMKFPTGRISYKLTNSLMNGTSTFAWVESGKKFRQDMKAKMTNQGKTMDVSTWVIYDGKNIYTHNPMMGQTVQRMKVTPEMAKSMANGGIPMASAPKSLGKVLGKGTVAGKPCNVHALGDKGAGKIWVWENVPLKMEVTLGQAGAMKMEATKVETGVSLPATYFKVPKGMNVTDFQRPAPMPRGTPPAKK
jgi:outer membrane lipoprotein-sorting protein